MHYVCLALAVVTEVAGMAALKSSNGFTKIVPAAITIACFLSSFIFMAVSLHAIPIGVAYALWSGIGIVLVAVVGWIVQKESLDPATMAGVALILMGCVTVHLASQAQAA